MANSWWLVVMLLPGALRAQTAQSGGAEAQGEASADELEFEGTAEVEAPPGEPTKHSVEQKVVSRVPGTRGDALRAIELMPGVARTSLGQGDPILRGAAAGESQVFLNGIPVPLMFHFGGLTSFINSRLVGEVDVYPGNYSARYGRASGGVVDIALRDSEPERTHALLDLNLIDSSAFVETNATQDLSLSAAVRRSNIDLVFEKFVPEDSYSVVAAPTYFDYQAVVSYHVDPRTRVRLLGYGSRDSLKLFFADARDEDPALVGSVEGRTQFHRLGLELTHQGAHGISGSAQLTAGRLELLQRLGDVEQDLRATELYGRAEAGLQLAPSLKLTAGADFFGWFLAGRYHGPQPGSTEGDPTLGDPLSTKRDISVEDDSVQVPQPAVYLELSWRPLPALLVVPGVRLDYYGELRETSVDPRLGARLEVADATTVKGGVGLYSQPPQSWQSIPGIGNPELEPLHALQTSLGVERRLGEHFEISAEGFYRRSDDIVVGTEGRVAPHFENTGQGRAYGLELSGEGHWQYEGFAYLAYTLSRSERRRQKEDWRPFDLDQPHVLSLVASQGLGHGWNVGLRFRFVSGNPITPVTGATYDARTGVYVPSYGGVNSQRKAPFHQLDARVEKAWQLGALGLAAYLDVQNVYLAKNPEGYRYSYDYSERESVSGLGFFPNLGLRGEL